MADTWIDEDKVLAVTISAPGRTVKVSRTTHSNVVTDTATKLGIAIPDDVDRNRIGPRARLGPIRVSGREYVATSQGRGPQRVGSDGRATKPSRIVEYKPNLRDP